MICDPNNLKTDFHLLLDGPILVMSDHDLWNAGIQWLQRSRGYKVHSWQLKSEVGFYNEVSETLLWKQQFGYSSWGGNLDALNDGATSWPDLDNKHIVIAIDNAERLKKWFGNKTHHIWDIFQNAARMQLFFGVGLLVMVKTTSDGEATRWAKAERVSKLTRKSFPGKELLRNAEIT
jgi:hypothetical protein